MAKTLVPVGTYPIFAIMGGAFALLGGILYHNAKHQDMVWNPKGNPTPWLSVQQGQTTKLVDINGSFKGNYWKRSAF